MARIENGILGGISGKVGTVVGAKWKGIDYIRARAGRVKQPNSPAQQAQKARFILVQQFLQSMKGVVSIGYKSRAVRMTERNSALAYIIQEAVTGEFPDLSIDYAQVQISRGSLLNAARPVASAAAAGMIRFDWINNGAISGANPTDRVILAAYSEALRHTEYSIASTRASETALLMAPAFSGYPVHTWISFISENTRQVADSVYTGVVEVV